MKPAKVSAPASAPASGEMLTTRETAKLLRVSPRTITRHAHMLGAIKVFSRVRFRRAEIERFLERARL